MVWKVRSLAEVLNLSEDRLGRRMHVGLQSTNPRSLQQSSEVGSQTPTGVDWSSEEV